AQLRRLVDRVGQRGPGADRRGRPAGRGTATGRLSSRTAWDTGTMTDDASTTPELPAQLAEIREDFLALTEPDRLQLLLEFSRELPELPERYALAPGLLEKVEEC